MDGAIAIAAEMRANAVGRAKAHLAPRPPVSKTVIVNGGHGAKSAFAHPTIFRPPYFASTGSGGTLSFGAPACMVISVIEVMS